MQPSKAPRGYWMVRSRGGLFLGRGVTGIDLWSPDPRFGLCWSDRREAVKATRARASEFPGAEVVVRPGALKAAAVRHPEDGA